MKMGNVSASEDVIDLTADKAEAIGQYFFILENIPCASFLVDDSKDHRILYGNTSFFKLFGYTEGEMRYKYGDRLGAIVDSEHLEKLRGLADEQEAAEWSSVTFEQEIRRKDGSAATICVVAGCFRFDSGRGFCCVAFDITDGCRTSRMLKDYREIMDVVTGLIHLDLFEYHMDSGDAYIYDAGAVLSRMNLERESLCRDFVNVVIGEGLIDPEYEEAFRNSFENFKQSGKKTECEFRMRSENGKFVWILLTLSAKEPGGSLAAGILRDITQEKELSRNYLNETQFYQAMLSEKDAYGHADITEDRCTRFGGMWTLYNEIIHTMSYSDVIDAFINKVVHPEDRRHYLELMQRQNFIDSFENGIDQLGCEFRRIVEQNKMMWMELKVHLFRDPYTHHILALLYIKNIDARKKQELSLLRDTERDHLTNIYNRKMAESLIKAYLKNAGPEDVGAFIILDMDNFKYINDTFGHKTGDEVLVKLAETLSHTFRRGDVIGRFGGDEFILFLKNIGSEELVVERLNFLIDKLKEEKEPEISSSMGVVMLHGNQSYERVFRHADAALYAAKSGGRGRFVIYRGEEMAQQGSASGLLGDTPQRRDDTPSAPQVYQEEKVLEVTPFDTFIAEHGDMAYLVDPESFTLICGNAAFYDRIGRTERECVGMKCYEAMHKRETPCPFCSKANWSTDKFYLWRNLNNALEQEFLIKNKLVQWNGKEVLLALAVDISNNKSIVDSMDNGATESHSLLSGIQSMAEAPDLKSAMDRALEAIGYFFRADSVRFWRRPNVKEPYEVCYFWAKAQPSEREEVEDAAVNAWLQGRKWEQPVMIESQEAMLCYSFEMYEYMKDHNIYNQRWFQLKDGDEELGCIVIENSSSNFQNIAFIESFTVFIANELNKRNLMENMLYIGRHDDLTGLLNRRSYDKFLQDYDSDDQGSVGVVMANLNNLKGINSSMGFHTGDYFISQFASILNQVFEKDAVFRLNGDEFLVIISDINWQDLEEKVLQVEKKMSENRQFSASIGYAWDNVEKDLPLLIEQATQAMKVNKKRHYDTNRNVDDTERRNLLRGLVTALENNEFEIYLQPKVDLVSGRLMGAEALIRYHHKDLGIIMPGKFIDVLEKNNAVRYVDLFVFETVCRLLEKWKRMNARIPVVSLNFSRLTLLEHDILSGMEKLVSGHDMPKQNIEIEITESFIDMGKGILYQAARDLYQAGYAISLDDFGTKYTSLSILADMDFNTLKLDKSLISALAKNRNKQVILHNVISMCEELNIDVIAEGVETKQQEKILLDLGCRAGQGYLYGKPMPISAFEKQYELL